MTAVTYCSPRLIPPRRPRNRTRAGMPKPKPSPPPLIDAALHAESFRQVREAHRVELVEDYVELISDLNRDGGEARQVDIAARLGVAHPARKGARQGKKVNVRVDSGGRRNIKKPNK